MYEVLPRLCGLVPGTAAVTKMGPAPLQAGEQLETVCTAGPLDVEIRKEVRNDCSTLYGWGGRGRVRGTKPLARL